MGKILFVDDDILFQDFERYIVPMMGNEALDHHLAIYLSKTNEEMKEFVEGNIAKVNPVEKFNLASVKIYNHAEMVKYLREIKSDFHQIVLDGLEGRCFDIVRDVPLDRGDFIIYSNHPGIILRAKDNKYEYLEKGILARTPILR